MKQNTILIIIIGLASLSCSLSTSAKGNSKLPVPFRFDFTTDSVLIAQLASLNLASYQNKPVDTLLVHLPAGYTTMKIGGWRSQRLAEVLYIIYPGKISVGIHVRNFQFMNPHLVNTSNPTQNWDINLFKKESIAFAIIYNDSFCINGCENQFR